MSISRIPFSIKSGNKSLLGIFHLPEVFSSILPVVIMCHGLGGDKCGRARTLVSLSECFSKRGIASVRFDFQGNGDSEGGLFEVTTQACVKNLLDIVTALISGQIYPEKRFGPIVLFGRSFGGYVCIQAALKIENLAGIAVQAPPFDASCFETAPFPLLFKNKQLFFLGEPMAVDFLQQIEQIEMKKTLKEIRHIPFFHISSELDRVIPVEHTQKYREERTLAVASSRFLCISGADHECSEFEHRAILIREVVSWCLGIKMLD